VPQLRSLVADFSPWSQFIWDLWWIKKHWDRSRTLVSRQFQFRQSFHTHLPSTSEASTTDPVVAGVPNRFSLIPPSLQGLTSNYYAPAWHIMLIAGDESKSVAGGSVVGTWRASVRVWRRRQHADKLCSDYRRGVVSWQDRVLLRRPPRVASRCVRTYQEPQWRLLWLHTGRVCISCPASWTLLWYLRSVSLWTK
jgi:hypothetical protein